MMKFILAVVGCVAVALAQESSCKFYLPVTSIVSDVGSEIKKIVLTAPTIDTGPMFNPDTAPFFGTSGLVYPTATEGGLILSSAPTVTPSFSSSAMFVSSSMANSTLSTVTSRNSTTLHSSHSSHSSTHSSSSVSVSRTASRTPSSTAAEATASESAPAETGAAVANFPEAVGMIVGGIVAGLAIL